MTDASRSLILEAIVAYRKLDADEREFFRDHVEMFDDSTPAPRHRGRPKGSGKKNGEPTDAALHE